MHTVFQAGSAPQSPATTGQTTRVAVAGATGYTGQQLLRLLARHPAVNLTAAMSSGATAATRPLPALPRIWSGAITPLAPLAEAGLLLPDRDIIIDAKSGVSGAGKTPSERTHFSECHGSVSAYGVFNHRHGAEIEQGLGRAVTFTPHLVPLDRGLLSTIYVRLAPGTSETALGDLYERAYA